MEQKVNDKETETFSISLLRLLLLLPGIWPDGADGTDINAVCRSHDGSLLASADDFGKVHLFSYPCSQPRVSVGRSTLAPGSRPAAVSDLSFKSASADLTWL